MPTIYDVAKKAKVSTYTVSSVINQSAYVSPELTQRVLRAVRALDYTPNALARGLQTRRTRMIAVLVPDIGSSFYGRVVCGVEAAVREAGYSLLIGNTFQRTEEQARYLNLFRSQQVDGFLAFITPGDESEAARLVSMKRPAVFVGSAPTSFDADMVITDEIGATQMAVDSLIESGFQRVAILLTHRALSMSEERIEGWRKSLRRHKIAVNAQFVVEGNGTEESGYAAAKRLLSGAIAPNAFLTPDLATTTGVLRALREKKIAVPSQCAIACSEDSPWLDAFEPPITTIVQPGFEMGQRAAELLLKRIARPTRRFERVLLTPKIQLRTPESHRGAAAAR